MLNNYLHDFAVAILFSAVLVLALIERMSRGGQGREIHAFVVRVYRMLTRLVIGAWVVIIVGGAVRTVTYTSFEWSEAAGKGQIAALMFKHILLAVFVIAGTVIHVRLRRRFRSESP